ncbi:hypothetical protein K458DRAFT_415271 [Lentithecium fluviatile CBS 122367]|uniref:Uncharacterized protein n=1 Tax=Lentithecium fluviatile CBS 122367 TaxID=1168545 RepID=A0A6G1JDD3_9PLEO|nr:hypothetical protein K458DRAFT_415271 [Lentithecium fluviatile CBS 122367]
MGFRPINLHTCGNDAAYTLIILLCLASRILGTGMEESAHARDLLDEVVQIVLGSARTAKGKWKAEKREEKRDLNDWMDNFDGMGS